MYEISKIQKAKINGIYYVEVNRILSDLKISIQKARKICNDNKIKYYKKDWDLYVLYDDFNLFVEFLFKPLLEYMSNLQEIDINKLYCNFESKISDYMFTEKEIYILDRFYEMCQSYNCFEYWYKLAIVNIKNMFNDDETVNKYPADNFKELLNKCTENINCKYKISKNAKKYIIKER